MEIAIIALFIVSIALIAFSYSQRDPMKDVEQEAKHCSFLRCRKFTSSKRK